MNNEGYWTTVHIANNYFVKNWKQPEDTTNSSKYDKQNIEIINL